METEANKNLGKTQRLFTEISRLKGTLAAETSFLVFGKIASVTLSIGLVKVLSDILTLDEFGCVSLGLTLATLFSQVVFSSITPGAGRLFSIASEKLQLSDFFGGVKKSLSKLVLFTFLLALAIGVAAMEFISIKWGMIALFCCWLAIVQGVNVTLSAIQNAARCRGSVALQEIAEGILKIGMSIVLTSFFSASAEMVVFSFLAACFVVTTAQLFVVKSYVLKPSLHSSTDLSQNWQNEVRSYSRPFVLWGLFTWLQTSSDRWALSLFSGTKELGLYAILFQLGYTPVLLTINIIASLLGPIVFSMAGDGADKERMEQASKVIWRVVLFCAALTILASSLGFAFHSLIFRICVSEDFRELSYLLPYMLLAGGLSSVGQLLSLKLLSKLAPNRLLIPKISTAIVSMILNFGGAYLAGPLGVVVALILSSVLYSGWMILICRSAD